MAIKAGQILHAVNNFIVDRIQTGGAGALNIPQEKIHELGNYQSVGIVRDMPDLSFSLDCLEVDTELEALLCGSAVPSADAEGTMYALDLAKPMDILSPWKSPYGDFAIVRGVAIPQLTLESASYKYGLKDNAGETYTLKGDCIYYVPGVPYQDTAVGDGTVVAFTYAHGPALAYTESGVTLHALNVSVDGTRMTPGDDYTESTTAVTFLVAPAAGAKISIVYGSAAAKSVLQTAHEGLAVKPAAIHGRDIDVFFSTLVAGSPVEVRWPDVQTVALDWKVTLEDDYEFGNSRAVSRDATDVPDVTGTIEIKPRSVQALFARMSQITGVPVAEIIGPQSSVAGALRIEIRNPDSGGTTAVPAGTVLKTHYVPAARFTIPGYEGKVQAKLVSSLAFESDDGVLETYKGARV